MVALSGAPLVLILLLGFAFATRHADLTRTLRRILLYTLLCELIIVLILACVGAVYERVSTRRDRRLYPPPGRLIDVGGHRLHLYCRGQGTPTVVLEHGLVGSYLDWYLVQPKIAAFTRVCSYDRAGYGWSDFSPNPRLPSVMCDELHELLIRSAERPPFIVVGHSMGGFDALIYAKKYSAEVAGIVLVDASHPDETLPFSWRQKLWLRSMQLTAPFGLPRWRDWCASGPKKLPKSQRSFACEARAFRTNYEQWAAFGAAAEEVRRVTSVGSVPLMVISRDPNRQPRSGDVVNPDFERHWWELQKDLLKLSENSKHILAEWSGHGIPQQRPDVVVSAIREMLDNLRSAQRFR
ncbi:MAG TPA: alpha/beta hydrolase [Terriglobales bacterium]|nr:alpha/beta hydrolase [Terriglobales bacterium]